MKPASNAPVYAALYSEFAELARKHGYALAIHGSLQRDFDVIAVPWVELPSEPRVVIDAIKKEFAVETVAGPTLKLHGRICWSIVIGFGETQLDFSFMPLEMERTNDRWNGY